MNKTVRTKLLIFSFVCMAALLSGCRQREDEELLQEVILQEQETSAEGTDETMHDPDIGDMTAGSAKAPSAGAVIKSDAALKGCYVHIYGAVKNPGVYLMEADDRIFHVIGRAGGFAEDACEDYVNQAKCVSDGLKIWIPTKQEAAELHTVEAAEPHTAEAAGLHTAEVAKPHTEEMSSHTNHNIAVWDDNAGLEYAQQTEETAGKVNINTAAQEQLCTLTGIGEAKAKAIIAYRDTHGKFLKPEDIMQVTGIKQSGYEKIRDQITVN